MKVTNFGPGSLPLPLAGWSSGVTSVNSNFNTEDGGLSAVNFVQQIQADGNRVLNPIVNFASGSNITLTIDRGPLNSTPSNTIRVHATGGGTVSAGSNSTRVSEDSSAGASTSLWSPFDHRHDGIGTITASSSNTLQRGTFNMRSGNNVSFGLTDSDGDGELDTMTIHSTGGGGGSSGNAQGVRYYIQSGSAASASSTTRAITFGSTPTNGNIIYAMTLAEGTDSVSSISQTNVTWTNLTIASAGVAPVIELWKGVISASASTTMTVTWGASGFHSVIAMEWSGTAGTLVSSQTRHVTTDSVSVHPIPLFTATNTTDLVITAGSTVSNSTTFSNFNGVWLAAVETGRTIGCAWGFPGTNTVYGSLIGGNSGTSTGLTVGIA